jgi:hypothetical protein
VLRHYDNGVKTPKQTDFHRSYLDSIGPFFTFVAGEGSPLTPDDGVLATALLGSRLGSRSSVHGREERKKKNEENVLCEADGHCERPLERGREGKR